MNYLFPFTVCVCVCVCVYGWDSEGRRGVLWRGFVAVHSDGVRKLAGEYKGEGNRGEV